MTAPLPSKLKRARKAPSLELTLRDQTIIEAVYRFRFLTTEHIMSLTGTAGRRAINRRLRELYDAKFLDRPTLQHSLYAYAEKRPTVHALGNEGAKLIERLHGIRLSETVRWTDKNNKVKSPEFILHTLGVADFYISLMSRLDELPRGLNFISQEALLSLAPAKTKRHPNPLSFPTSYRWWKNGDFVERSTVADGLFSLTDERDPNRTARALFFLEYDGNTMPVVRSTPRQSSIIQKMLGYADIRTRKLHKDRFGYPNFRVLFVTRDRDQRIKSMCEAWENYARTEIPAGAFLFADYDELVVHSPFGNVWVNAKGESVTLIPDFSL